MKTVIIDAGHGGSDTGASYHGHQEKNLTLKLALKTRQALQQNYKAKVLMTRAQDKTVSLDHRTDFANNHDADYFCSIHLNAGGGSGFESYIYNGSVSKKTIQAQDAIHEKYVHKLAKKYDLRNRGQKRANFHVLRETRMSAILLESLFIDSDHDLKRITKASFRKDAGAAIAEGIADALSLPVSKNKKNKKNPSLYHVIAGSFKEKQHAKNRVAFLNQQQIEAIIKETQISGDTYYRVQAGAFRKRANANRRITELKKMGIAEPFLTTSGSSSATSSDSDSSNHSKSSNGSTEGSKEDSNPSTETIRGDTRLTAAQIDDYAEHLYSKAPKLGSYYEEFGKHYGIRGDIAFAQALHETDNFRFTGIVNPEQHNYCGLGATGPDHSGASFETPEKGVLAHIQHLYAYATDDALPEGYSLIDPRFKEVKRGSAKTWAALNGKWAVPGKGYGQTIVRKYKQMRHFAKKQTSTQPWLQFLKKLWQFIKQALRL